MKKRPCTALHRLSLLVLAMGILASPVAEAGIFGALDDLANAASDAGVNVPGSVYDAQDAAQSLHDAGQQAVPETQPTAQQGCPPGDTCTPQTPPPTCPPGDICTPTAPPDPYAGILAALRQTHYIQVGHGPMVIYDFMDPMCMYCFGLYHSEIRLIREGKITVRYVLVAAVQPSSPEHAAWILQSPDPAAQMQQYDQIITSDGHSGQFENLPEASESAQTSTILNTDAAILNQYRFGGVPVIAYRARNGQAEAFTAGSMTSTELAQRLGLVPGVA